MPVNPDARTYVLALLLALFSGFLFALVPVRQVLRADPWQIIRSGSTGIGSLRRFTLRDVLLALQIAICAVLVTASLVAVRGLARSLHSNYGFEPQGAMLVKTDLHMAGYDGDQRGQMQRRMLDAAAAIPGVTRGGLCRPAAAQHRRQRLIGVHRQHHGLPADEFRRRRAAVQCLTGLFPRGRDQRCLAGRALSPCTTTARLLWSLWSIANLPAKFSGRSTRPSAVISKSGAAQRVEVVGVVEDGKYETLTEDPQPAMFYSFLQQPSSNTWLIVRSQRDPQEIAAALQRSMRSLDPALPLEIKTWNSELDSALFAARVATVALGVLGLLGAMLAITGIFGMASYVVSKRLRELGIRVALGANQRKVLGAALGRAFRLLAIGSVAGMILGVLATRVLSYIVYQATPKDPIVLGGVILTMLAVGLVAAWIPARHALAVDPMILLREE